MHNIKWLEGGLATLDCVWPCMPLRFHFNAVAEANGAEGEGQSNIMSVVQLGKEQVAMKEYVCKSATACGNDAAALPCTHLTPQSVLLL